METGLPVASPAAIDTPYDVPARFVSALLAAGAAGLLSAALLLLARLQLFAPPLPAGRLPLVLGLLVLGAASAQLLPRPHHLLALNLVSVICAVALSLLAGPVPAASATVAPNGPEASPSVPGRIVTEPAVTGIRWRGCPPSMPAASQCGRVTVPRDWGNPGTGTFKVAVARLRATGSDRQRKGILVFNPGGPGGSGLGALATIGSTAPFVGLLGTVWGIIKAFQKMAIEGGGGLGTVSGAIAEALINTAFGLLVAIPAVMFFNNLTNRVEEMQVDITDSTTELVDFFMKEGR